jgi:HEAT repeats
MRQIVRSSHRSTHTLGHSAADRDALRDLSHLRRRALGEAPSEGRTRDVVQLAESRWPLREQDLAAIVLDDESPSGIRHLAATLLGRIDTDEARDALRHALAAGDARVAGTVAQSLGRIGTRLEFKALGRVMTSGSGVALRQVRFARLLIAHRLDLDLPDAPDPLPELLDLHPNEGCALDIDRRWPRDVEAVFASLASQPFGVTLDPRTATAFASMHSRMVMLLTRGFAEHARGRFARAQVLGVCARRFEATDHYSTWLLVLATPATDSSLLLRAYRPNGSLVLIGEATAQGGDDLAFALRSVRARGALPTHFAGIIDSAGLHLRVARMGCERVDIERPTAMVRSRAGAPGSRNIGAPGPSAAANGRGLAMSHDTPATAH